MRVFNDKLEFDNAKHVDKIEDIPGLRVFAREQFARGGIDAIAAACKAIGITPPKADSSSHVEKGTLPKGVREYQIKGIEWLIGTITKHGAAILADDMGLGKTLQTMCAVRAMREGRVLVLCPAAALETWRDELFKWGVRKLDTVILSSSSLKAARAEWERSLSAQWVVCSYDHRMVERCMELAFQSEMPEFLVLDEAHRLRGRNSKRSEMLESVRPLVSKVIAITATPQFNRPRDLFQLLRILYGYRFGNQFEFDKRYSGAHPGKWGGLEYPKHGSFNADELKLRLSYYLLRREKRDVAHELPPLTFQVRWVDPTSEARKEFLKCQMSIGKGSLHAAVAATLKGKVQECLDLAVEARRFVLATWMKTHAREFHRMLSGELETPCVLITGDMPTIERASQIRLAEAKGWGVVATTDSISESLNLQHVASVGILHALDWVPLKLAQLFARIHRLGSVDPVIWYLVAMRETVDQIIMDTQVSKLDQYRNVFGQKSHREIRHALADEVAIEKAEKEALKLIYEAMK